MSAIDEKELIKVINETLGIEPSKPHKQVISEAYVLEPKKYSIQTDVLSQKALSANIEDFEIKNADVQTNSKGKHTDLN